MHLFGDFVHNSVDFDYADYLSEIQRGHLQHNRIGFTTFLFCGFIGLILSVAALKVTHIEKLLLEAREREREREQRAQEAEEARRRMSDMRKLQGTNGLSTLSGTNTLVGRSGTHTPATNEPQSAEQSIKS
eukprot:438622_1